MNNNFDYLDTVLDQHLRSTDSIKPSESQRKEAEAKSRKLIAGFRVRDEAEERRQLDHMVKARSQKIEQFFLDREYLRKELDGLGVKPLTVVPIRAWSQILKNAGLFTFRPNAHSKVGYDYNGLRSAYGPWKDSNIDALFKGDPKRFLLNMFPHQVDYPQNSHYMATLVLPDPPADVAEVLIKVQGKILKVAAVAEAISFVEKASEIVKRANIESRDIWAQQQGYADYKDWVKRDPIVYMEHGSAAAIVAQFGEFPIEKEIVDAVVKAGDLLPESIGLGVVSLPNGVDQRVMDAYQQAIAQRQLIQDYQQQVVYGGIQNTGGLVGISTTTGSTGLLMPQTFNSATWTGR